MGGKYGIVHELLEEKREGRPRGFRVAERTPGVCEKPTPPSWNIQSSPPLSFLHFSSIELFLSQRALPLPQVPPKLHKASHLTQTHPLHCLQPLLDAPVDDSHC